MMDGLRRGATLEVETAPLAEPLAAQCLLVGTDPEDAEPLVAQCLLVGTDPEELVGTDPED